MLIKQRPTSLKIHQKLSKVLPGGCNSPIRSFRSLNIPPLIAEKGEGDLLFDADGNSYIDYCNSFGPLIHGHAHPHIVEAVQKRISKGMTFGVSTALEEELASLIVDHIPSIDVLRFVNSGTEATMTALRLARAYTQRDVVVKFAGHYHGHNDALLVQAGSGVAGLNSVSSSKGVPDEMVQKTLVLPFNDREAVETLFQEKGNTIAAVIVEPVAANMGVVAPENGFLELLRTLTENFGSLLIFDEVITGFRLSFQGAQGFFGVEPDITCYGKIIGGGFPIGAFGGKQEIMHLLAPLGEVYQAGTLSGNPAAMEAGLQTLKLCLQEGFYEKLEEKANTITKPIQAFLQEKGLPATVQQCGSLFSIFLGTNNVSSFADVLQADSGKFKEMFCCLLDAGIYLPPYFAEAWFISAAHTEEHLVHTKKTLIDFFENKLTT